MIVTELRPRRHRLTALVLAGVEQPIPVDTETLLLSGVGVGDDLSQTQLDELLDRSQRNRAYEKALYLLEYRAHSRAELLQKVRREYPLPAAEEAVERVAALGLIDDEAFARDYARELFESKRYGARRVEQELRRRGIDGEIIDRVLAEQTADPVAQITAILQKKYTPIPTDPKALAKVLAAMVRRGYEYGQVRQALLQLTDSEIEDDTL